MTEPVQSTDDFLAETLGELEGHLTHSARCLAVLQTHGRLTSTSNEAVGAMEPMVIVLRAMARGLKLERVGS